MGRSYSESRVSRSKSRSLSRKREFYEDKELRDRLDEDEKDEKASKRLFVSGLSPRTTDDGLLNFLKLHGPLTECHLVRDGKISKCFGFVSFKNRADAEKLLRKSKDSKLTLDGNNIRVKLADVTDEYTDKVSANKLFVGKMNFRTTDDGLLNYFRQFGAVTSGWILRDNVSNRSRGFGFVVFEEKETVIKVLAQKDHKLDGEYLLVKLAIPKNEIKYSESSVNRSGRKRRRGEEYDTRSRSRSRYNKRTPSPYLHAYSPSRRSSFEPNKLFVRGLGRIKDKYKLENVFKEFGEIEEVFIVHDADKRSRGIGFVTFSSHRGLERALRSSDIRLDGQPLSVTRAKFKLELDPRREKGSRRRRSHSEPKDRRYNRTVHKGRSESYSREHRSYPTPRRHSSRRTTERIGYGSDRRSHEETSMYADELVKPSRRHSRTPRKQYSPSGTRHKREPIEKLSRSHRKK